MRLEKFSLKDFDEYKSWYQDTTLNKALGPAPGQEWLDVLEKDKNYAAYSIFKDSQLVAFVTVLLPDIEHPAYYIPELAVKPNLRDQGIGAQVIAELKKKYPLKPGESWKAFVDIRNTDSQNFFKKLGWRLESEIPSEHGMLTFSTQN